MRRLIINADDFGLTPGVNRAIFEAHDHGVVTSATMMAKGGAFENAVQLAKSAPEGLDIGCHVVLVDGSPMLDRSQVTTLTQNDAPQPQFYSSIGGFARRALLGKFDEHQLEAEIAAQIRKIQAAGVVVSHLDTHKHTHVFPQVLRPLLAAAKRCGIRSIRNPFELIRVANFSRPDLWSRALEVGVLRGFAKRFKRMIADAGMASPDGTLGIVATGGLDERLFEVLAKNVPEGTWEFVCHPGYNDADLQSVRTRLRESREHELKILTSPRARECLLAQGIELISYRGLLQTTPAAK